MRLPFDKGYNGSTVSTSTDLFSDLFVYKRRLAPDATPSRKRHLIPATKEGICDCKAKGIATVPTRAMAVCLLKSISANRC